MTPRETAESLLSAYFRPRQPLANIGTKPMTKRDYQLIASVFANCKATTIEETGMKDELVDRMADALARGNPEFKRDRFLAACHQ